MRWIHDVSTDPADPPLFVALRETRQQCANGVDYSGLKTDEHCKRYPELQTVIFTQAPAQVFNAALTAANALGWKIAASVESEGRIEATAVTRVFRFKDDVVIRVRSKNGRTLLDTRSASRVGESDLGANAKRISIFLRLTGANLNAHR